MSGEKASHMNKQTPETPLDMNRQPLASQLSVNLQVVTSVT